MSEHVLVSLAAIVVLGIGAQWVAWRLHLPSIIVLLAAGFIAGPVTGVLKPDALLGDLLFPLVSLSVALILFEGGLTLHLAELRATGSVVRNLVIVGAAVTWGLTAACAHVLLGFDWRLSALQGAVLVVTGPTVVLPLLLYIRPTARTASVLKWEGIVIDPIGATLSLLVFESILAGGLKEATGLAVLGVAKTIGAGFIGGLLLAGLLVLFLKRFWIPDHLQETISLMAVVVAFTGANAIQEESGLLAVTVMGVLLANQKWVMVKHIVRFKENLRVLLISGLFIILSARLELAQFTGLGWESLAFVGALVLIVRPAAVMVSSLGSGLTIRERAFVSWLAPRGIVAAAVSSVFALRLAQVGYPGAESLVPITFLVIAATVVIYGLTAPAAARALRVAQARPTGFLFVGAHPWAREIASTLQSLGQTVRLVDTNWEHVSDARMEGLSALYGNALSQRTIHELDLNGIGRLLALTPNDEANALSAMHFSEHFGREGVYQLPPEAGASGREERLSPRYLRGRFLFGEGVNYSYLTQRFAAGAVVKVNSLGERFDYDDFRQRHGERGVPLFLMDENDELHAFTADAPPDPRPGQRLVSLVDENLGEDVRSGGLR